MSKSIVSNEYECLICKKPGYDLRRGLHKHHVFYGTANRAKSEEWGCWVWLCPYHHNGSMSSVHEQKDMDLKLKRSTQEKFEELYGHEKFMEEFGRSWL